MTYQLHHGNCLDIMPMIDRESIDAIVTDPPYGLGFMGKDWDHGVPGEHFWREAYRVAKPGAHLLAFGGTRTFHRLTCAIEDAGWEIRDCVMWVYGSGFPKSHDASKAIDKRGGVPVAWFGPWFREWRESKGITQKEVAALFPSKTGGLTGCVANWELGFNMPTPEQFNLIRDTFNLPFDSIEEAEREVIGKEKNWGKASISTPNCANGEWDITIPATPAAQQWQGWGTALKPAWEPIIVARKPLAGTVAENVQRYGTGAINVDACRIGTELITSLKGLGNNRNLNDDGWKGIGYKPEPTTSIGRWPANLIHDGSAEVLAGFPMTVGAGNAIGSIKKAGSFFGQDETQLNFKYDNGGSAARFFYCAKASKQDRDEGLEGLPIRRRQAEYGSIQDARPHTGDDYEYHREERGNHHPTVKPTALMRYLCRLVTPPQGVILDPFMGSGSTGKAAILEGFNFVGIDTEQEYIEIAARRIEHACGKMGIVIDQPMLIESRREMAEKPRQMILL